MCFVRNIYDFIKDFPFSIKLNAKILLVIIDRLNKGVILIRMLWISALEVAMAFIERYILYHGFPKAINSDKST